jgi:hypothetical protein
MVEKTDIRKILIDATQWRAWMTGSRILSKKDGTTIITLLEGTWDNEGNDAILIRENGVEKKVSEKDFFKYYSVSDFMQPLLPLPINI